ncbi:acetyl-CoA synthetase-like protein [Lindgomyces ingoldianus]|uniref:Acetyl-CoA synthetase-like protein n=1 Tax=Lindgomyces ingoldianus TaxID=673940 RepID=A0ACB6QKZ9_9PLEO|nr:acetyl-CoA synthetase-like protein [Lindgomyces ingoldianus]KAF2467689.1 acetyl-CoA synthetase-like protein [Lindgomyces ingoldianus]
MCFDKSMFTIVAMMATLKAGGACVHLGRNSPIARMSEIIEQTGASIVLTDNIHASKFDGVTEAIVIDQPFLDSFTSCTPLPEVSPSNPAFVLFTSGSTGKPKGVVVEHGSLCTSSRAHGTNRKLLQFAAYTFDRGGCICVPSEDERINDLAGVINRMNCNYGFLIPTVAGMLDPKTVPSLKRLILGGELLTQDNVQRWAPMVDLIISYRMTKCIIHCVDAVPLTLKSNPANLGRPSRCHMWIVDAEDHKKLTPIGAVGELVIEGRMVSRGYLNNKAKTDAAFILDLL